MHSSNHHTFVAHVSAQSHPPIVRPRFTRVLPQQPASPLHTTWPALHTLQLDTHPPVPSIPDRKDATLRFIEQHQATLTIEGGRLVVRLLSLVAQYINNRLNELVDGGGAALVPLQVYYLTHDQLQLLLACVNYTTVCEDVLPSTASSDTYRPSQFCFGMTLTGNGKMCVEVCGRTVRCAYIRVNCRAQLPVYDLEVLEQGQGEMLDPEWELV